MLVQGGRYHPAGFPYQHRRAGESTGIRCGSKKDLVAERLVGHELVYQEIWIAYVSRHIEADTHGAHDLMNDVK